jgi:hypothetical protein
MLTYKLKDKDNWAEAWDTPAIRRQLIIGSGIMLAVVATLPKFFNYMEKRNGTVLHDWLLAEIPPHNVSVAIFSIIWGMGLLILIRAIKHPSIYINYSCTLIFVCLARYITIFLVPLNPPVGLIHLTDPLTAVFYGESNITKDLFFSGHTATLTLMVLCLEKRNDKIAGTIAVALVMTLLLVQHIHYTIDVLAAPVVVYGCFRLTRYLLVNLSKPKIKAKPAVIAE